METVGIAAVILAAGVSSRFGSPKPLARVGPRTMLEIVADAAAAAGCVPVLAVVAPDLPAPAGVMPVLNGSPELGISHSLRRGLAAVPRTCEAAIVVLADQPTVDGVLLRRLIGARGRTSVVATRAEGVLAPPVLLEREAFPLADAVAGDVGLRQVFQAHPEIVTAIDLDEALPDVDVPADLARILGA